MHDIFLSYSTQDRERVSPLFEALAKQGWSVFWDHLSIRMGKNWSVELEQAINASRCVVVVWSEHSIQSEYVREEANIAKRRGVLLPICLDKVEPPFGFTLRQATDFSRWNQKAEHPTFIRLASEIYALLNTGQTPPPFVPVLAPKAKLRWPLYAGVSLVALAAAGGYQLLPKLDQALEQRQAELLKEQSETINPIDDIGSIKESNYKSTSHVASLINRSSKVLLKINDNSVWYFSEDEAFGMRSYKICEAIRPSYCLNTEHNELISSEIQSGWYSAKWIFERTDDGYFSIRNAWKINFYIYMDGNKLFIGQRDKKSMKFQWHLTRVN
ncbi:TIR domain-containing protein [Thiothrix eikelboomii]|uniref:TIR domain-containing protein n=1 Tax=Thiothrix eikelboomii TaxID=92487 RepID=UPI003BAE4297